MLTGVKEKILSFAESKGGKGSICVIGGSFEYSGAPFFSAISALRIGIDLAFVICDKNAATVIKSYSPELIVFGLLDHSEEKCSNLEIPVQLNNRVSAIVVGPGLSRNVEIFKQVTNLLTSLKNKNIPIIFDGDGIHLFKDKFSLFESIFNQIIITPNANEFRLFESIPSINFKCLIYAKGKEDKIYFKDVKHGEVIEEGAPRRCGGIGDILGGVIAGLLSMYGNSQYLNFHEKVHCLLISGKIVRRATKMAFATKRRSMSAVDIIEYLGPSFEQIFE